MSNQEQPIVQPENFAIAEDISVAENMRNFNHLVADGELPTADDILTAEDYAQNITREGKDSYVDKQGNQLDTDDAEEFLLYANPSSFVVSETQKNELTSILSADHMSDLTPAQQQEAKDFKKADVMEPGYLAFRRYKEEAQKRLDLSSELSSILESRGEDTNTIVAAMQASDDISEAQQPLQDGSYRIKSSDELYDNGIDKVGQVPSDIRRLGEHQNKHAYGYENPVAPGKELELFKPAAVDTTAKKTSTELAVPSVQNPEAAENITNPFEAMYDVLQTLEDRINDKIDGNNHLSRKALINFMRQAYSELDNGCNAQGIDTNSKDYKDMHVAVSKTLEDLAATYELSRKPGDSLRDARESLHELYFSSKQRGKDYLSDEDKGKRRKILGGVAGIALLAGSGYAAYKLYGDITAGSSHQHAHDVANRASTLPKATPKPAGFIPLPGSTPVETTATVPTATLFSGDTVWHEATVHLASQGISTSASNVYNETQRLLDLNNLTWAQAKDLQVGTVIQL
jgi:hypothetical protein